MIGMAVSSHHDRVRGIGVDAEVGDRSVDHFAADLAFARKFPGHYMAMFESGVVPNRNPELSAQAQRAETAMLRATEALLRAIPEGRRPPAAMVAAHVWAMAHGVVELHARAAPGSRAPYDPEALLESGIGIYLRGLGLLPPDS